MQRQGIQFFLGQIFSCANAFGEGERSMNIHFCRVLENVGEFRVEIRVMLFYIGLVSVL